MPDGLTHMAAAVWVIPALRRPERRWLLYAGAILPDVVQKTMTYVFRASWTFAAPAHSLLGVLLVAYLAAHLFEERERAGAFAAVAAGSVLHLLADALKDPVEAWGVFLLDPFVPRGMSLGLFEPEKILWTIPAALVVLVLVEGRMSRADARG